MPTNVPSRKEIRDRWVELRERLGWSQTDLGRELGVGQVAANQWEAESRSIPQEHLAALAARAGEPLTYFYEVRGVREISKREKLIFAKWMEEMVEQLRAEALATVSPEAEGVTTTWEKHRGRLDESKGAGGSSG